MLTRLSVSIFISPKDYMMLANECQKVSFSLCGHDYSMWCRKDKIEQANSIVYKFAPIVEKVVLQNQGLSFDKIMFMAAVEFFAKMKLVKDEQNGAQRAENLFTNTTDSKEKCDLEEVIELLNEIKNAL